MEPKLLTAERFVDRECGCSYRYVTSNTEYFRPHYHDYCELFLMLDGCCTHLVNNRQRRLKRGDLVFIRPADVHDYVKINEAPFSFLNLTFTVDLCRTMFAFLGKGFPGEQLWAEALPPTVELGNKQREDIARQMGTVCSIDSNNKEALGTALRILLFRIFSQCFTDFVEEKSPVPEWLDVLCDEMRRNGNFVYGTKKLFSLSDKTREHISRCMKRYLNQTPSEFINELRVQYIANMLQNSNHSIGDVVFDSGFGNLSWANTCFKEKYGMTMREYRYREEKQTGNL